jgi:uncharacterized membrane protein
MTDDNENRHDSDPQAPNEPRTSGLATSGHRRQLSPEEALAMEEKIRKVELAISLVLRVGVILSVAVIAVGLVMMFLHHGAYRSIQGTYSYHRLTAPSTPFPHRFSTLWRSITQAKGQGLVILGVLILILTPVLRVAVGVLSFLYEKDIPMTFITLYVLAVLIASFFLAGA